MLADTKNLKRYTRNIIIEEIGAAGQQKLLGSKVLIAGAGGLGSTVISNLSSVGIGTLGIVDNDQIELSNLNRQYIHKFENIGADKVKSAEEWVRAYNPEIEVITYPVRLDENNYSAILEDYDLVIDCFDSYESKFFLNRACVRTDKVLIHGGVTGFSGQVMTIIPGKSSCLNCLFQDYDTNNAVNGVLSPSVSTIASIQSMECVKFLLGIQSCLINTMLSYNGINQNFKKIKVSKVSDCPVCGKI